MAMVLAIGATACTGADDSVSDTSGDEQTIVGNVVEVVRIEGRVGGDSAVAGADIPRGAELATDSTGIIRFEFRTLRTDCLLYGSSAVRVINSANRLLRLLSGEATCEVAGAPNAIRLSVNGRTVVLQRGTVLVAVADSGGGMQVLDGNAGLSAGDERSPADADPSHAADGGGDSGQEFILGPGDQESWDSNGNLDGAVSFGALDQAERSATSDLTGGPLPTDDATNTAPPDGDIPTEDADGVDPSDDAGDGTDDPSGSTDADEGGSATAESPIDAGS